MISVAEINKYSTNSSTPRRTWREIHSTDTLWVSDPDLFICKSTSMPYKVPANRGYISVGNYIQRKIDTL